MPAEQRASESCREAGRSLALGVLLVAVGATVIIAPMATTIRREFVLAFSLILAGIASGVSAFTARTWFGRWGQMAGGMSSVAVGSTMLLDPIGGQISALPYLLVVDAVLRIVVAIQNRRRLCDWGWVAASGIMTLFFTGLLLRSQLPVSPMVLLGPLAGVNLILNGWSYLLLGLETRGEAFE